MLTTINIHSKIIKAAAGDTAGAPLTISGKPLYANQDFAQTEICFFVQDFALARKLSIAINSVIAEHQADLAAQLQAAE